MKSCLKQLSACIPKNYKACLEMISRGICVIRLKRVFFERRMQKGSLQVTLKNSYRYANSIWIIEKLNAFFKCAIENIFLCVVFGVEKNSLNCSGVPNSTPLRQPMTLL